MNCVNNTEKKIDLIPASLNIIFQSMKMCSFCNARMGEEAVGLNYLATIGYFVCGDDKCKMLSYNYRYFIVRSVYSIGIKEPFSIRIYKRLNDERGVSGLYTIDDGWNFSKIKKTTYINIYNRVCILIEKNNEQREIIISDLLNWNFKPAKKYIDKYVEKYNPRLIIE